MQAGFSILGFKEINKQKKITKIEGIKFVRWLLKLITFKSVQHQSFV